MPSHQDRREPLPTGYQFGDARDTLRDGWHVIGWLNGKKVIARIDEEVLDRVSRGGSAWNVIEGEQH